MGSKLDADLHKRVIMFWAFLTKAVGMRHAMKEVAYG
jgi:hypothetical protein